MIIGNTPMVWENVNGTEQMLSIEDWELIKNRRIFHTGHIDTVAASQIAKKLFYLAAKDEDTPIQLIFEDCPGGSVTAGMVIYDAMQYVPCEVETWCMGQCASMGALLFAAGGKGKRYIMENAQVMIHQPSAGTQGTVSSMAVDFAHFADTKTRLNEILAKHTGQSQLRICEDTEKDYWFSAEEAIAYGLADAVLQNKKGG